MPPKSNFGRENPLHRLDSQTPQERTAKRQEQLSVTSKKLLEENRHQMREFIGTYPPEEILADVQEVNRIKGKAKERERMMPLPIAERLRRSEQLAVICEAGHFRGIKEAKWLGDGVEVNATSPYDNWVGGTDLTVAFKEGNLGLTFDITFANQIDEKFDRIRNEIERGELGYVKYFKSPDGTKRPLAMVPRVVVGIDSQRLEQMLSRLGNDSRDPLQEPAMRDGFIEQIRMQLSAFAAYARSVGQQEAAEAYARDLAIIDRIVEKHPITTDRKVLSENKVFQSIAKNLEHFRAR